MQFFIPSALDHFALRHHPIYSMVVDLFCTLGTELLFRGVNNRTNKKLLSKILCEFENDFAFNYWATRTIEEPRNFTAFCNALCVALFLFSTTDWILNYLIWFIFFCSSVYIRAIFFLLFIASICDAAPAQFMFLILLCALI